MPAFAASSTSLPVDASMRLSMESVRGTLNGVPRKANSAASPPATRRSSLEKAHALINALMLHSSHLSSD